MGIFKIVSYKLFEIDFQRSEKQNMPGWTVFHALISTKVYGPTSIGYCQAIAAPPFDLNTVYTVLKRADSMFQRSGQSEVILAWDEALYSKAQIIKWRNPDLKAWPPVAEGMMII